MLFSFIVMRCERLVTLRYFAGEFHIRLAKRVMSPNGILTAGLL